jgi:2-oxoisovalerate dehydrogenase E2 component (dihydrolipoyl transacylase)
MALYTFRLPDIGEGIAEAEIVAWHVQPGDMVGEDSPLADMMTDKATVEMESPVAGRVVSIAGEVGDRIPIGSVLVEIEVEGDVGEGLRQAQPERKLLKLRQVPFALSLSKGGSLAPRSRRGLRQAQPERNLTIFLLPRSP